jgi:RNA polymerase sigma-70 factor, ECF subfamily
MMDAANPIQRFEDWVRRHGSAVRGFLLALVRRSDVADDLLQEVFRRAWQARQQYTEEGKSRAYLLRIADRLVVDWQRARRPEVHWDAPQWQAAEPPAHHDPADLFAARESRQQLQAALEELQPLQRRVLLLRYYGELSFQEIANTVGCPLNTALSHCRRGLLALRKILTEHPQK